MKITRLLAPVLSVGLSCLVLSGCRSLLRSSADTAAASDLKRILFYSQVPRDVEQVVVAYPGNNRPIYTITGANLFKELDRLVEFKPSELYPPCDCFGTAAILFVKGGEVYGSWKFAGGSFFARTAVTIETDKRIADWFASKGVAEFRDWVGKDSVDGFSRMPSLYELGLDYLVKRQNPDGSWGEGNST